MIRRPPRSTLDRSSAASDVYKRQTLDRREALKDADFVTTQFRVGLLNARVKDERIPFSYGMLGQETNGAGGMFKACLLYTSPSPRDRTRSRMPSSA